MKRKIIKSFILYTIAFFIPYYIQNGTFLLDIGYQTYFTVFMISWLISSLISRKFKIVHEDKLLKKFYTYSVSFFLMLGILAFLIYNFSLLDISRFVVFTSLIISFSVEIGYILYRNKQEIDFKLVNLKNNIFAFLYDFILFGIINIYLVNKIKGNLSLNIENILLFFNLYSCWFAGALLGNQLHLRLKSKDTWTFIWGYIKSSILILALISFSGFINQLSLTELYKIYYAVMGYLLLSFIGVSINYYFKLHKIVIIKISDISVKEESGDVSVAKKIMEKKSQYVSSFKAEDTDILNTKFKNFSLARYPEVYSLLDESVELKSFDYSYSLIIKSDNVSNIDYLPDGQLQFLLNLEKINRVEDINEYLAEVNKKMAVDGIFIGTFETAYLRHQLFLKKYPFYLAQSFYSLDFIWNRIIPKIHLLKSIHLAFEGKANKIFSLAEGFGRLYFSGFKILNTKIIDDKIFFVAKKIKEPVSNFSPSTGLILKLKKIGRYGKPIVVYKIRTMYPYSEYLQDFVLSLSGYSDIGKPAEDFRVTGLGRILRKYWLDELPQIVNVLKGEMRIIGIRPISQRFLDEFPEDIKKIRYKYKPGCIPPYVSLLKQSKDGFIEAEITYIKEKELHPYSTDIKYIFSAFYNVFTNRIRSA